MSNPAGTWNLTVASPFGDQKLTVELVVDGAAVSGVATHEAGRFPFDGGTYRGDQVVFQMRLTEPVKTDLRVTLTADGDTITGKAKAGILPAFRVSGARA